MWVASGCWSKTNKKLSPCSTVSNLYLHKNTEQCSASKCMLLCSNYTLFLTWELWERPLSSHIYIPHVVSKKKCPSPKVLAHGQTTPLPLESRREEKRTEEGCFELCKIELKCSDLQNLELTKIISRPERQRNRIFYVITIIRVFKTVLVTAVLFSRV